MEDQKRNFSISTYGNDLRPGNDIKVNGSLSVSNVPGQVAKYIGMSVDAITTLREGSIAQEQAVFDKMRALLHEWADYAAQTAFMDKALEYLRIPSVQHTANQWVCESTEYKHISNMVYCMSIRTHEYTKYDHEKKEHVPVAWYATWSLHTNSTNISYASRNTIFIAGQDNKRFPSPEAREKYIEGRVSKYAALFSEISPPIPKEYTKGFMVHGHLLPGYSVEEDILQIAIDAMPMNESSVPIRDAAKPSVHERLADARERKQRPDGKGKRMVRAAPEMEG